MLDAAAVNRALCGVSRVYHLAGFVSRRASDAQELYRVHVDGTRRLLEAARQARVARVVVASSSGTIGVSAEPDVAATENDPYPIDLLKRWPYYLSKVYQEREALEFGRTQGIDVVCINPSLLLGPGDTRLSSTQDVLDFIKGRVPAVPAGGLSFVDVRDVAVAASAAMERGRSGERYLLGAANWTFEKFLRKLEQVSGVLAPRVRAPRRLAKLGLDLLAGLSRMSGREFADAVSLEMAQHYWYIDCEKAKTELGFAPRDPETTLVDTVKFLRTQFLAA